MHLVVHKRSGSNSCVTKEKKKKKSEKFKPGLLSKFHIAGQLSGCECGIVSFGKLQEWMDPGCPNLTSEGW